MREGLGQCGAGVKAVRASRRVPEEEGDGELLDEGLSMMGAAGWGKIISEYGW